MTAKIEKHLPEKAPKRTGRKGVGPVDYENPEPFPEEPPVPSSEDVAEFLDGVNSTREKRKSKAKKPEIVKPQAQRLPGMTDNHLEDLEEAAFNYAGVRDKRMALLRQETDLKDVLHNLMKRYKKILYRVEQMEVKIVSKEETVKVKILKSED